MGKNDYQEDLEYLYSALLKHPAIIVDEKKKTGLENLYLAKEETVRDYENFIAGKKDFGIVPHVVNRCARLINDKHF